MRRWARWLGCAAIVAVLAWKLDGGELLGAFGRVHWPGVAIAVALLACGQAVSSRRWQLLARPLGFERPLGWYVAFYYVGMFFNLVLPTTVGGDVVRAWYLGGRSGRGWAAFLSVFSERFSGLAVLVALACVGACLVELPPAMLGAVLAAAGAFLSGGAVAWALGRWRGASRWLPAALRRRLQEPADDFRAMVDAYSRRPGLLGRVTLLSLAVQLSSVLQVWAMSEAMGLGVPLSHYLVVVPLVALATLLPLSLNGMGLREAAFVLLLAPFGVEPAQAVALGLLQFAVYTVNGLAGGGCYLLGRFPRYEGRCDAEAVGGDPDQGREGQLAKAA